MSPCSSCEAKSIDTELNVLPTDCRVSKASKVLYSCRPVGWILLRGVLLFVGRYVLVPEALTRALIRPEPLGGSGGKPTPLPGNFANLGSLKCYFLHFDIISEVGCIFLQYRLFGK